MSIVTISRGSYSMGVEIAQRVADWLGYECVAREVLLEASCNVRQGRGRLGHGRCILLREKGSQDLPGHRDQRRGFLSRLQETEDPLAQP